MKAETFITECLGSLDLIGSLGLSRLERGREGHSVLSITIEHYDQNNFNFCDQNDFNFSAPWIFFSLLKEENDHVPSLLLPDLSVLLMSVSSLRQGLSFAICTGFVFV